MIGVPPTAGFFSKWYLILGGIDSGHWEFVAALLFSSLVNAVLFFRIFEIAFFEKADRSEVHDSHGHDATTVIDEAPWQMLAPLLITAILLVAIGLYSGTIVENIIQFAVPAGI
jgi:multicomponent Na+:H+ antiporter subunit D